MISDIIREISEPVCPFYINGKGNELVCEIAKFTFPDALAKQELKRNYCCDIRKCEECTMHKVLMSYYDRKETK